MTLAERLAEYVRAAFPGLYVVSHEHDDAVAEIATLCRQQAWTLACWDLERGLSIAGTPADTATVPGAADPLAAVRALKALATPDGTALLVLRNYHRFVPGPEVIQALDAALAAGKQDRTFVVILAPVVVLPPELERQFVVVEHELPGREPLERIARAVATEPGELPEGDELDAVLEAAAGLTRLEAEGAFALSLVRHGRLAPAPLWELKSQALTKSGLLSLYRGGETFADLGGLEALKAFCSRALRPGGGPGRPRARGLLLLGVAGVGKSLISKALGNETNRPTLILDIGALKGSLVGQTEERTRRALALIDRMSPCVVLVDEIEKALAGVQASGQADSGVTAGMFGTILTWLNDRTSDSFVVATCNDISKLPPELSRAERFDGVFFLDLPGRARRT